MAIILLLPLVVWEAYELWFGSIVKSVKDVSPAVLVYLAVVEVICAAWTAIQAEYLPRLSLGLRRATETSSIAGLNLSAAGLMLVATKMASPGPVLVVIFVIADLLAFQVARDLLDPHYP
jgi:hypothetical protein